MIGEGYSYESLSEHNKEFIDGYDWCVEYAVDNFFDNLDESFGLDSHIVYMLNEELPEEMKESVEVEYKYGDRGKETRKIETYGDYLREKLLDWIDVERDETIVSMIDSEANDEDD